jgi:hypothetical protein
VCVSNPRLNVSPEKGKTRDLANLGSRVFQTKPLNKRDLVTRFYDKRLDHTNFGWLGGSP